MSSIVKGFAEAVGRTPLIRLGVLSQETGCEILGKAEFMNPGGSVKDRAALAMIEDAERAAVLQARRHVVEGTAGNTGIGLAHVCRARLQAAIIVMPDNQSEEKFELLEPPWAPRSAASRRCPTATRTITSAWRSASHSRCRAPSGPTSSTTRPTARRTSGPPAPRSGRRPTASLDAFVTSSGTGGTLGGISRYLKKQNPKVLTVLADPQGSALYEYVLNGQLKATGPGSITEGIGIGRVTANLEGAPLDTAVHVNDAECVKYVYRLLREEGLFLGSTSGVNVAAAVQVARRLGPGHTIVTILCDTGAKYQSRLFDRKWIAEKGLTESIQSVDPRIRAHG
jgi:cysteine synthase A